MSKQSTKKTYVIWGLLFMIILIALDRITKLAALKYLKGQSSFVLINGVFELSYLENRGVAFGMLQNQRIPILILGILILFGIGYCFHRLPAARKYLALHIILAAIGAGAVGNLYDRISYGFVVDFIFFSLINFPVFNMADIYVTVSCVIVVLLILFYYKEEDFEFLSKSKKSLENTGDKDE